MGALVALEFLDLTVYGIVVPAAAAALCLASGRGRTAATRPAVDRWDLQVTGAVYLVVVALFVAAWPSARQRAMSLDTHPLETRAAVPPRPERALEHNSRDHQTRPWTPATITTAPAQIADPSFPMTRDTRFLCLGPDAWGAAWRAPRYVLSHDTWGHHAVSRDIENGPETIGAAQGWH